MINEFFPPTEEELEQIILEIQQKMEDAESQLEYDQLHDQLKDFREKRKQLINSK